MGTQKCHSAMYVLQTVVCLLHYVMQKKNYELIVEEKIIVHCKIKLIIIVRLEFSAYTDSSLSGENTQH